MNEVAQDTLRPDAIEEIARLAARAHDSRR